MEDPARRIPSSVDDISPAWLSAVLGADVVELSCSIIGADFGFASTIARAVPRYADRLGPASVVVKLPSQHADPAVAARWAERDRAEVGFYRTIGDDPGPRVPRCHYAAAGEESGRSVLVLEDLGDARFGDAGAGCSVDDAALVVDELAALHARWWESPSLDEFGWLGEFGDVTQQLARFPERRVAFFERYGDVSGPLVRGLTERIGASAAGVLGGVQGPPQTMVMVDAHADNVAFIGTPDGERAVLYDWQGVARGLPTVDISHFLSGALKGTDRRHEPTLLGRYHDGLVARGVEGYSQEELLTDYRVSLLRWWVGVVSGCGSPAASAWSGRQLEVARQSVVEWETTIEQHRLNDLL